MPLPDIQSVAAEVESGECTAAIPLLEQMVDTFPTYSTAYLLLARAYRKEGNRQAALQALAQVQLWSLAPGAVKGELREIIRDHLDTVYSTSDSEGPAASQSYVPPTRAQPETPGSGVRTPRGGAPEDLVEDLEQRLGPAQAENDDDIKDLNSLIERLEGARIQPEPEFGGADPSEGADAYDEDNEDEVVSETLARIYAAQKEYRAAVETYHRLAEQHPDRAEEFQRKAREMEERLS